MSGKVFAMANGLIGCNYVFDSVITASHEQALKILMEKCLPNIILGNEKAIQMDYILCLTQSSKLVE